MSRALLELLDEHDKRAINFAAEHGKINVTQMVRLAGLLWTQRRSGGAANEMRILDHKIREMTGAAGRDGKAHLVLRARNGE